MNFVHTELKTSETNEKGPIDFRNSEGGIASWSRFYVHTVFGYETKIYLRNA